MDATTALLRIAARAVQASAAVVARTQSDAPVAAWGCDAGAARALVATVRRSPDGRRIALILPIAFADGSAGELILAAPRAGADAAAVEALAREMGTLIDPAGTPQPESALSRLAESIERLGDAVAIVEVPLGPDDPTRIIAVNAEFEQLFGYDASVVGSPARILWGPLTDRDGMTRMRTRIGERGMTRANTVLYARDGTPRWTELVSTPAGDVGECHYVIVYRDVTSRKMIVDALAAEKQKLETTLGAIGEAVVTVMADGIVDYVNEAAEVLLATTLADVYGYPVREVLRLVDVEGTALDLVSDDAEGVRRGRAILRGETAAADIEYVASRIDGKHGTVIVLRDVTAEHRLALRLSFEAAHDPLTGLQNRRAFLERLEEAIRGARDRGEYHALAFLDLDRFKVVNDRFGHATGDRLLAEVGRVMGRVVRGGDVLARIGGDEFACLLSNCRLVDARRVAEKLRAAVDGYRVFHEGESLQVGVSIGLAAIEANAVRAEIVLAEADAACYQAKAAGRNTIQG
jgi:diguanylate cyclase (GGDEF)-like protein/PAS domain S-box-containing protein